MSSSLTFKFFSLLCSVILNETRIQSDVESRSSLLTFVLILLIAVGALPVVLTGVHSILVLLCRKFPTGLRINALKRPTFAPSPTSTQYIFWQADNAVTFCGMML